MWAVLLALVALFVALHLIPFAPGTRERLAAGMGETAYKLTYITLSAAGLFGAFFIADRVPVVVLWTAPDALRWLALVLTALGFALIGAAYGPGDGTRLARHPMLAGIGLWAGAHVLAGNDLGHLVVFGMLTLYAPIAMLLTDWRLRGRDPCAFAALEAHTSLVPFTRLTGGGLPWPGVLIGLAAWAILLALHTWLFDVSPLPGARS